MKTTNKIIHVIKFNTNSGFPSIAENLNISRDEIPNTPESPQSATAAVLRLIPLRINLWDRWSRPPVNGDNPRLNLDITATLVSKIGTASNDNGIARER